MASMNGYNQIHDTEINVEGVEPEKQQTAVDEIRWFLKILSTATKEARGGITVRRVVIAKDFNASINELSPQLKTSKVKYKAQRHTVRAIGKIIEHVENELADQRRLSNHRVPDQAYLCLDGSHRLDSSVPSGSFNFFWVHSP